MNSSSLDSGTSSTETEIVPIWKRILAFAMDMILLIVLLQSIVHVLPNAYSDETKKEFNQLIIDASLLSQDDH